MDDEPSEAGLADGGKEARAHGAVKLAAGNGSVGDAVVIAPRGDVVLDVLFGHAPRPSGKAPRKAKGPVAFRVASAALKKHSRYFSNLLGDTRFQEARTVEAGLAALALDNIESADADISRLPRVRIEDDDAGSGTAVRELVFAELLRILHWDGTTVPLAAATSGDESPDATSTPPAKPAGKTAGKAVAKARTPSAKPRLAKSAASSVPSWRGAAGAARGARSEAAGQPNGAAAATQPRMPGTRWSAKSPPTLLELATLALQADRFLCTEAAAAYVRALRLRFPQPIVRAARGDSSGLGLGSGGGGGSLPGMANEEAIRQKVFVAWLLDQPIRFHAGTRELILYGSQRWRAALAGEDDEGYDDEQQGRSSHGGHTYHVPRLPAWWDLPDGVESELEFRRACIVNCIASVPRHFLGLYTSRNKRQCKMGYESSAACDSFQLGEIVKFLFHKDLLFLQDVSSTFLARGRGAPLITPADYAAVDIQHILATLKQCPAYQLDKHHVNCGLRTRILPILEYIQAMLGAGAVALHRHEWTAAHHGQASWLAAAEAAGLFDDDGHNEDDDDDDYDNDADVDGEEVDGCSRRVPSFGKPPPRSTAAAPGPHTPGVFRFTRSLASDQRLRIEGSMAADRMARQLFAARRWNWTPEA